MAGIVAKLDGTFFDPAVGSGGLLMMARSLNDGSPELIGFDINVEALRLARAANFIYGENDDLRLLNSLCDASITEVNADAVLVDPPINQNYWGDANTYRDRRWIYGAPSPFNANSTWLQVALLSLRPGGVALVLMPMSSLEEGHREGETRKRIIESGALQALVLLPSRMRLNTSQQLVLWVLRRPTENERSESVLVVDATVLGRAGREEHTFEHSERDEIIRLVQGRLQDSSVEDTRVPHISVPVDDIRFGQILGAYRQLAQPAAPDPEDLRDLIGQRRIELESSIVATQDALRALMPRDGAKS
jgi:type I restriction-modification system DNA methylase subunit